MQDERDTLPEVEAHVRAGQSENANEDVAEDIAERERIAANDNEDVAEDE
jgi:hypothetical protein